MKTKKESQPKTEISPPAEIAIGQSAASVRICVSYMQYGEDLSMVLVQLAPWPWMEQTLGKQLESEGLAQFDSADMSMLPMKFYFRALPENAGRAMETIRTKMEAAGIRKKHTKVFQE